MADRRYLPSTAATSKSRRRADGPRYTRAMVISRAEVDERLARAAEVRRTLRRATRKLTAFGAELLAARDRDTKPSDDPGSR
jgi:hypothetical protein